MDSVISKYTAYRGRTPPHVGGTMPIRIHLTAEDLTETRFAFSPIWEVMQSFLALGKPSRHVFHLPWMNAHREAIAELDLTPMAAMYPTGGGGYLPDFTTPPPEGPYPVFGEELERVRSTPHDQVAKEVRRVYEQREMPPAAARFLESPDDALDELVRATRRYWETAIEPHWPRMRGLLGGAGLCGA